MTTAARGALWARICQSVVAGVIVLSLTAAAAELMARYIFNLSPLVYTRPPHPVLFAGNQAVPLHWAIGPTGYPSTPTPPRRRRAA